MPTTSPPHEPHPRAQVESALYGMSGGGSVYRLLQRESLSTCPLALKRSSVAAGLVTDVEYNQLIKELESVSPMESKGRIRNVTLLSVSVSVKLAHALGRGPKTVAFLRALSTPLPMLWQAQMEQEANREEMGGVDLLLDDEIAELEEEECHMALELVASHVPYAEDAQDETKAASWQLPSVPAALRKELDDLVKFRTEPINRQRDGSCCVDLTVGNDVACCKRFLGWLLATKQITAGLGVFCRGTLSEWAEEWLRALRDRGLKYSSLANCNSAPGSHATPASAAFPHTAHLARRLQLAHPSLQLRVLHVRARCRRGSHHHPSGRHAVRRAHSAARAVREPSQARGAVLEA